jgi:hypothetical protein
LIGFGDGSSFIVILPPSVSFVNDDEELEVFFARTVLLTTSIVDDVNNMVTIITISIAAIERIFIIMT